MGCLARSHLSAACPLQLSHASRQADKQAINVRRASLETDKCKEGKLDKKTGRPSNLKLRERQQNAIRQLNADRTEEYKNSASDRQQDRQQHRLDNPSKNLGGQGASDR
jgi:hypothetical protein